MITAVAIRKCYKCHRTHKLMATVYAIGEYWMCDDCIRAYEKETDTVAVLFYDRGLQFLSHDECDVLKEKHPARGKGKGITGSHTGRGPLQ